MEKNALKLAASSLYPVESKDSSQTLLSKAIGGITGCTLIFEHLIVDELESIEVVAGSVGLLDLLIRAEQCLEGYLFNAPLASDGNTLGGVSFSLDREDAVIEKLPENSLVYLQSVKALIKRLIAIADNKSRLEETMIKLSFAIFCVTLAIKKIRNEAGVKNVH